MKYCKCKKPEIYNHYFMERSECLICKKDIKPYSSKKEKLSKIAKKAVRDSHGRFADKKMGKTVHWSRWEDLGKGLAYVEDKKSMDLVKEGWKDTSPSGRIDDLEKRVKKIEKSLTNSEAYYFCNCCKATSHYIVNGDVRCLECGKRMA